MSEHVKTRIFTHCSFAFGACNAIAIASFDKGIGGWKKIMGCLVEGFTLSISKRYIHPFVWCMRVGLGWVGKL
jgi:hypothetical protein